MIDRDAYACLGATTSRVAWIDAAVEDAIALARLLPGGTAPVVVLRPAVSAPRDSADADAEIAARFVGLPSGRCLIADEALTMIAVGAAIEHTAEGPDRAAALARFAATIDATALVRAPGVPESLPRAPLLIMALTFAERSRPIAGDANEASCTWGAVPAARCVLPRLLLLRDAHGRWYEQRALLVRAGEEPGAAAQRLMAPEHTLGLPAQPRSAASSAPAEPTSDAAYLGLVEDAIELIRDGALRKIVLARSAAVALPQAVDLAALLRALRAAAPSASLYAVDLDHGGLFVGATPELLFAREGSALSAMALAATCPRSSQPDEDERRIAALLDSTKERKEHGLVVEHLVAALRPRCAGFAVPTRPAARAVAGLIHLETLLRAELLPPAHVDPASTIWASTRPDGDLLTALHPTPAVCGLPAATAAHWLHRREGLDRGLYAGVLGWSARDRARYLVPLRGGVLSRDRRHALLFAGAGVVETSQSAAELAETELKFAFMRRVLIACAADGS